MCIVKTPLTIGNLIHLWFPRNLIVLYRHGTQFRKISPNFRFAKVCFDLFRRNFFKTFGETKRNEILLNVIYIYLNIHTCTCTIVHVYVHARLLVFVCKRGRVYIIFNYSYFTYITCTIYIHICIGTEHVQICTYTDYLI